MTNSRTRRKLATVAMTAALVGGGAAAGATLGAPIVSGAQDTPTTEAPADDPAVTPPTPEDREAAREQYLGDALQPLIDDGTLTQAQVDAVIAALEEAGPPPGMHHGPGRGPGLDAAAEAIGISVDDLRTALQDGSTIAEVAEAHGVTTDAVVDAMVADLQSHLADEVASGEHTQEEADAIIADATDRITAMVNGEGPVGPPMGEGGPGFPGGHGPRGSLEDDAPAELPASLPTV